MTANDCPDRDPKNWKIVNEKDDVIHSVENEGKRGRFQEKNYAIEGEGVWCKQLVMHIYETNGSFCP